MSVLAALRALPALREYSDAELAVLVTAAIEQRMSPGTILCREGEVGRSCFLVVSGEAEVVRAAAEGERVLATIAPGTFIGQIALVDRGPRSATVRGRTEGVTLELSRDVFERLLSACSPLALRFQGVHRGGGHPAAPRGHRGWRACSRRPKRGAAWRQ
ncbi:MAG: cyclic nucleotide-binding domain-containing protein [Deltaproteobacteria bacterium]|nr:cyclic nucleotide-binding domain-containing protein [Deltaproteobacteria bacterium]